MLLAFILKGKIIEFLNSTLSVTLKLQQVQRLKNLKRHINCREVPKFHLQSHCHLVDINIYNLNSKTNSMIDKIVGHFLPLHKIQAKLTSKCKIF